MVGIDGLSLSIADSRPFTAPAPCTKTGLIKVRYGGRFMELNSMGILFCAHTIRIWQQQIICSFYAVLGCTTSKESESANSCNSKYYVRKCFENIWHHFVHMTISKSDYDNMKPVWESNRCSDALKCWQNKYDITH